jgi:hypothetical protein
MIDKIISYCKAKKLKLKAEAEILFDKVNIYSDRDELAAAVHHARLLQVNQEYLEWDMRQQEAEKELPPEIKEPLFI